ncbi:MAG: Hsp33 family molecular chaperone HslO [Verrucomicrobiota bacterium]
MSGELIEREEGIEVESHYIRDRNVLLTRAEFSSLYVDYYLHLADLHLKYAPELDQLFKDLLAALILHGASRPWNEKYAWTLNFQEPRANLFVTGDNMSGIVVGTIFTDNVKESDSNLMFAEVIRGNHPKRRSVIDFNGTQLFPAVEAFYRQSEQRICRYFQVDDEEFWFLSAQPDCDEDWLLALEVDDLEKLEQNEELSLLEKRKVRWDCGCNESHMYEVLLPAFQQDGDVLFQGEESLKMQCPRCGMFYVITREGIEAFAQERAGQA